MTKVQDKQIAA
jgi:hypothetical protein